jgi:hypothetical protein
MLAAEIVIGRENRHHRGMMLASLADAVLSGFPNRIILSMPVIVAGL